MDSLKIVIELVPGLDDLTETTLTKLFNLFELTSISRSRSRDAGLEEQSRLFVQEIRLRW